MPTSKRPLEDMVHWVDLGDHEPWRLLADHTVR